MRDFGEFVLFEQFVTFSADFERVVLSDFAGRYQNNVWRALKLTMMLSADKSIKAYIVIDSLK